MFREKLRGRYRDFHIPCPATHITFPISNIPFQSGTFVTIDETTLTPHYHPKSIVYFRVFHCPKNPLCSAYSTPGKDWFFYSFHLFALFQNVTWLESYHMQPFLIGFFCFINVFKLLPCLFMAWWLIYF